MSNCPKYVWRTNKFAQLRTGFRAVISPLPSGSDSAPLRADQQRGRKASGCCWERDSSRLHCGKRVVGQQSLFMTVCGGCGILFFVSRGSGLFGGSDSPPLCPSSCPAVLSSCPAVLSSCRPAQLYCRPAQLFCRPAQLYCRPAQLYCRPIVLLSCTVVLSSCSAVLSSCSAVLSPYRPAQLYYHPAQLYCRPIVLLSCTVVLSSCPAVLSSCPAVLSSCPAVLSSCPAILLYWLKFCRAVLITVVLAEPKCVFFVPLLQL